MATDLAKVDIVAEDKTAGAWSSLEANARKTAAQIQSMESQFLGPFKALQGVLAAVGVAAATLSLTRFVNETIAAAAALKRMSEVTGATASNLSAIAAAARLTGTDMGTVEIALTKLAKGMTGAQDQTKGFGGAMSYLGLSTRDASGQLKQSDAMLLEIAKKMETFRDGTGKTALAMASFGKAGAQMIPVMKELAIVGDYLIKVTDEQARGAKEYEENLKRLSAAKTAVFKQVALELVPAMNDLVLLLLRLYKETGGWRDQLLGLAKDGSVRKWAEEAAMGVAEFADSAIQALYTLRTLAAGLIVILDYLAVGMARALTSGLPNAMSDKFEKILADDKRFLAQLQKDAEAAKGHYAMMMGGIQQGGKLDGAERATSQLGKPQANPDLSPDNQKFKDNILKMMDALQAFGALEKAIYEANQVIFKNMVDGELYDYKASLELREISEKEWSAKDSALRVTLAQANAVRLTQEREQSVSILNRMYGLIGQMRGKDAAETANLRTQGKTKAEEYYKTVVALSAKEQAAIQDVSVTRAKGADNAELYRQRVRDATLAQIRATEDVVRGYADQTVALQLQIDLIGKTAVQQHLVNAAYKTQQELLALNVKVMRELEDLGRKKDTDGMEAVVQAWINTTDAIKKAGEAQQKLIGDRHLTQFLVDQANNAATTFANLGTSIQESLSKAFGSAGVAAGGMFKAYADGIAKQLELDKQVRENRAKTATDISRLAEVDRKYSSESRQNTLTMYGSMASAAAQYFDKQSTAYKVLTGIEQAMYAVRLTMQVTDLAVSLGIISTKTAANIASIGPSIAAGAGQMFAQSGWAGFASVAAMLAVMAGLGFGGRGGGAGASLPSSADTQKNQNTGTVLGDASAKSKSIEEALKQLQSINQLGLTYTRQMTEYLANISNRMSGLVGALSRVTGLSNSADFVIAQGTTRGAVGSVINASNRIIDPLGGFSLIPGANRLQNWLGGSSTTNVINSGLGLSGTVGQQLVAPSINNQANTVSGINSFATVNTSTRGPFGGLFGGNSSSTGDQWRSLPTAVVQQIQAFIGGIVDSVEAAARALGVLSPKLREILLSIPLDLKLSLDGLKGQELNDAVNAFFSSIADKIALGLPTTVGANGTGFDSTLFFATFQKAGEGAFQTLIRIASEFETVTETFKSLGLNINLTGLAAMKATDNIVQFSGGLDNFQKQAASYLGHYYTPKEQREVTGRALGSEFTSMGFTMPTDPAGFRRLVEGLDLTTEAGQRFYAKLMGIEGSFYDFATTFVGLDGKVHSTNDALEQHKTLQERLDLATGKRTQQQIDNQHLLDSAFDATSLSIANQIIAQEALNEVEKRKKDIAFSNQALMDQLAVANGSTTQKALDRAAKLADITSKLGISTDATTISLQKQVWAQEDLNAAVATQNALLNQFGTTAQRATFATTMVNAAFGALGIAVPRSAAQFAAWVATIDPATESGKHLLTVLGPLAPYLATVFGVIEANTRQIPTAGRALLPGATVTRPGMPSGDALAAGASAVSGLNLELLRLTPGAAAAAEVTKLMRLARMAELTAQERQLGLVPGTLTAIQEQINAQTDLNAAQTAAAEAATRATNEMQSFAQSMDKLKGGSAYATQLAQQNATSSMQAVTAALPQFTTFTHLLTLSNDQFAKLTPAQQTLVNTALRAGGALQDLANSAVHAAGSILGGAGQNVDFEKWNAKQTAGNGANLQLEALKLNQQIYAAMGMTTGDSALMRAIRKQIQDIEEAAIENTAIRDLTHELNRLQNAAADTAKATADATAKLQAQKGIQDWLKSVMFGSNSPLTAQQQLVEARKQYSDRLDLARGGNLGALGDISKFADQYLAAQKAVSAFGGQYSAIFAATIADLQALAKPDAQPTVGDNFVAATIKSSSQDLGAKVAKLEATVGRLLEQILDNANSGTVEDAIKVAADKQALALERAAQMGVAR